PTHRRDRRGGATRRVVDFREAGDIARRLRASQNRSRWRRIVRRTYSTGRRHRNLRRFGCRYCRTLDMRGLPSIAVTCGEPAGIGPELLAMLAQRHAGERWPAGLVVLGDRV